MHRHVLEADEDRHAEEQAEDADQDPEEKESVAVNSKEINLTEIGKPKIGFTAAFVGRGCGEGGGEEQKQSRSARKAFRDSAARGTGSVDRGEHGKSSKTKPVS